MKLKTATISKRPALIATTPSGNTYQGISQTELLKKVKLLHDQVLKTNKYLMDVHRISVYNWDEGDTGNIIVQLPESKKGVLLDSVVRLRGVWDPSTNTPELTKVCTKKLGWVYKVNVPLPTELFGDTWKSGDYAMYGETGVLFNVTADMLSSLFTPLILMESDTIKFDPLPQTSDGIQVRAQVKIDTAAENDLEVSATGMYSNAYQKAKGLITIQETEPTGPNMAGGIRVVYLLTPPAQFHAGWLYLIPPPTVTITN